VGLGLGYDEVLLDAITRGGNGNHRFAETADVASAEIAQTVSDLLDVSVLAATLRITPSDEAVHTIVVQHDVPNWAADGSVVVALGDLFAGEQRRADGRGRDGLGCRYLNALGLGSRFFSGFWGCLFGRLLFCGH
jgi:Ca-activated chloride channel family protein